MHAPQIIYLVLLAIGIPISLARDGETKSGVYRAGSDFLGVALWAALLYWGGFFSH